MHLGAELGDPADTPLVPCDLLLPAPAHQCMSNVAGIELQIHSSGIKQTDPFLGSSHPFSLLEQYKPRPCQAFLQCTKALSVEVTLRV